ncbi:tetratricopeptide repeat protein [Bernardetia sp. Wsw4-3y2]|uniref:tetratricopeptide repeat protein n=1 Tax=Bernardetia sp. Wsw4-3y2 TaxID=3127471 RepID=UPI0030D12710
MKKYNFVFYMLLLFICLFAFSAKAQQASKTMQEGQSYFANKEYDKALKKFQKEYKKNPSIAVKFWIANTYAEMKDILQAKPLFLEIATTDAPELGMALVNLANCYVSLKQVDSAHFYYDRAIKEFAQMASGYFNKGQLLYSQSKFEEAKNNFDKAIEIETNNWWYYQKRLEVCFASQDFECALKDLIKVKALNPKAQNEMNLAYCYSMLKKYEEADSVFQVIYDGKDALFLNNYGLNKHNMGNSEEAKEIISKSLAIKPTNSYAYRNLAIIAIDEKDMEKGCEYLNKAKSLNFEKNYGKEVNQLLIKYCN